MYVDSDAILPIIHTDEYFSDGYTTISQEEN